MCQCFSDRIEPVQTSDPPSRFDDFSHISLSLTSSWRSPVSFNLQRMAIDIRDPRSFVTEIRRNLNDLRPGAVPQAEDRVPLLGPGLPIRLFFGIRTSHLFLRQSHPDDRRSWYRFYGFLTRGHKRRVLVQSDVGWSLVEGTVLSAEGLDKVIEALAAFLARDRSPSHLEETLYLPEESDGMESGSHLLPGRGL